jgi:hypothetical protein
MERGEGNHITAEGSLVLTTLWEGHVITLTVPKETRTMTSLADLFGEGNSKSSGNERVNPVLSSRGAVNDQFKMAYKVWLS